MSFLTLKTPPAKIEVVQAGKGRDLLFLHGAGGHMPNDPLLAALATKYRISARCCQVTANRRARTACATCSTSRCTCST